MQTERQRVRDQTLETFGLPGWRTSITYIYKEEQVLFKKKKNDLHVQIHVFCYYFFFNFSNKSTNGYYCISYLVECETKILTLDCYIWKLGLFSFFSTLFTI